MKLIKFLVFSVFFLAAIQCRNQQPVEVADLVLMNGKIVTVEENNPRAEALAVKRGTIMAIGLNKEIEAYLDKKKTKIINLQGKLALPGFNDSHVHFISGGHSFFSVSLEGVTSIDEMQQRVRSKDIFTIPEEEILNTDVVYTILGGKIVHSLESNE